MTGRRGGRRPCAVVRYDARPGASIPGPSRSHGRLTRLSRAPPRWRCLAYCAASPQPGGARPRGQQEGDRRRVPREPRHRDREVRRLPDHRRLVDAGRGDPLGRRHGQPGPALPRRRAGRAAGDAREPLRLRPRALLLVVHRRARALPGRWRSSRSTRAFTSCATPTTSARRRSPSASSGSPRCWSSSPSAPRCGRRARSAGSCRGGPTSGAPRARSCRSCCSRTWARSSAWSSPSPASPWPWCSTSRAGTGRRPWRSGGCWSPSPSSWWWR